MEHRPPTTALHSAFDTIEAALQSFEAAAHQHPAGSPAFAAALTDLHTSWNDFLSEWRHVVGGPPPIDLPNLRPSATLHSVSA